MMVTVTTGMMLLLRIMKMTMVMVLIDVLPSQWFVSESRGNSTIQHKEGLLVDELMPWCSWYNEA